MPDFIGAFSGDEDRVNDRLRVTTTAAPMSRGSLDFSVDFDIIILFSDTY